MVGKIRIIILSACFIISKPVAQLQPSSPTTAIPDREEFSEVKGISTAAKIGQSAAGLGLGIVFSMVGGAIGFSMATCGEEDWFCGVGETLIGASIGYTGGTSLGIWSVGKSAGGKGSYPLTLLGAGLGTCLGVIGAYYGVSIGSGYAAIPLFFGISNLLPLIAYNASDGRVHTRVTLEKPQHTENRPALMKFEAGLVLARW